MIDCKELRIGNYLLYKGFTYQVYSSIDRHGMDLDSEKLDKHIPLVLYQDLEPIPLDAELLEKCGFENLYAEHCQHFKFKQILIEIVDGYDPTARLVWDKSSSLLLCDVKYLHQLQNLIFAILREEINYQP